jgi:hypothetical protein
MADTVNKFAENASIIAYGMMSKSRNEETREQILGFLSDVTESIWRDRADFASTPD